MVFWFVSVTYHGRLDSSTARRFLERDWCYSENILYLVHRAERNVVRFVYELVTDDVSGSCGTLGNQRRLSFLC